MEHTRVAIIGSGPAGYTAAIYTGRAQLQPIVFAGEQSGGQLMWTTDIENFPGFPKGIAGPQLMMDMRAQAEKFGARMVDKFVTSIDVTSKPFKVSTADANFTADSIIIATGAESIMTGVPGEKVFLGRGVSTCAVCDAAFYRDKTTFVVGGGDSAMEDTLALTKFAKSVTVIHRRDSFKASKIMQERVLSHEKVKVMWNTVLKEVRGEGVVKEIVVETNGEAKTLQADGVFVAIGHKPMTRMFAEAVDLDDHGYVVTGKKSEKFPTMTSVEGVFAAGDNVDHKYKQAITAAGIGCSAALDTERWLESQQES